jgi:hypothetical protein
MGNEGNTERIRHYGKRSLWETYVWKGIKKGKILVKRIWNNRTYSEKKWPKKGVINFKTCKDPRLNGESSLEPRSLWIINRNAKLYSSVQNINPLTPNDLQRRRALSPLKIKILSKNMCEKPTNTPIIHSVYSLCVVSPTCFGCCIELSECLVHLFHCHVHSHTLFYSCVLQGLRHAARAGLWVGRAGALPRAPTSRGRRKGGHRPATR